MRNVIARGCYRSSGSPFSRRGAGSAGGVARDPEQAGHAVADGPKSPPVAPRAQHAAVGPEHEQPRPNVPYELHQRLDRVGAADPQALDADAEGPCELGRTPERGGDL